MLVNQGQVQKLQYKTVANGAKQNPPYPQKPKGARPTWAATSTAPQHQATVLGSALKPIRWAGLSALSGSPSDENE